MALLADQDDGLHGLCRGVQAPVHPGRARRTVASRSRSVAWSCWLQANCTRMKNAMLQQETGNGVHQPQAVGGREGQDVGGSIHRGCIFAGPAGIAESQPSRHGRQVCSHTLQRAGLSRWGAGAALSQASSGGSAGVACHQSVLI